MVNLYVILLFSSLFLLICYVVHFPLKNQLKFLSFSAKFIDQHLCLIGSGAQKQGKKKSLSLYQRSLLAAT